MIIFLIALTILILATLISIIYIEDLVDRDYYKPFVYQTASLDLEAFHDFYQQKGNIFQSYAREQFDGPGVYVIYNHSQEKYYFGQGDRVIDSIYDRLTDEADQEIHQAITNFDDLYVKMMLLSQTSYDKIDDLLAVTKGEFTR